jgi:hypothetical protein
MPTSAVQEGAAVIEYNVLKHLESKLSHEESLRVTLYIVHKGLF